jgi:hypothetical protein
MQKVTQASCSSPGSVNDPAIPGKCIVLGDTQLGPADFTNAHKVNDPRLGPGVEVGVTEKSKLVLLNDALAPGAPNTTLYRFFFNGGPVVVGFTSPQAQSSITLFVRTPTAKLANEIVASVHG